MSDRYFWFVSIYNLLTPHGHLICPVPVVLYLFVLILVSRSISEAKYMSRKFCTSCMIWFKDG